MNICIIIVKKVKEKHVLDIYVTDPIHNNFYSNTTEVEMREFIDKTPEELQELEFNINHNLFCRSMIYVTQLLLMEWGKKESVGDREEELLARLRQLEEQ